jgi:hypothetical protein
LVFQLIVAEVGVRDENVTEVMIGADVSGGLATLNVTEALEVILLPA